MEENQRVLAKEMDEHIVKQRVFQQNKRFKQMLEEKRDDPDFADSKLMPFCDEGWTVGDVKKYIGVFILCDLQPDDYSVICLTQIFTNRSSLNIAS